MNEGHETASEPQMGGGGGDEGGRTGRRGGVGGWVVAWWECTPFLHLNRFSSGEELCAMPRHSTEEEAKMLARAQRKAEVALKQSKEVAVRSHHAI